jgi:hypothetical protein
MNTNVNETAAVVVPRKKDDVELNRGLRATTNS